MTGEFKTASLTGSNFAGIVDGEDKEGTSRGQAVIVRRSSGPAASRTYRRQSSSLTAGGGNGGRGGGVESQRGGREHVRNPPPTTSYGNICPIHTLASKIQGCKK